MKRRETAGIISYSGLLYAENLNLRYYFQIPNERIRLSEKCGKIYKSEFNFPKFVAPTQVEVFLLRPVFVLHLQLLTGHFGY